MTLKKITPLSALCFIALAMPELCGAAAAPAKNVLREPREIRVGKHSRKIEAGRLLVKFKNTVTAQSEEVLLASHKSTKLETLKSGRGNVHRIEVPTGQEQAVLESLRSDETVEFAEFNELVSANAMPNDPMSGNQWHLSNISAPQAWDVSVGNNQIIVAILDTGVDVNHPDLSGRITPGFNIVDNNTNVTDVQGHGTAAAGSAVVSTNNSDGISSACWNCRIMPVRIAINQNGGAYAYYSTISSGMQWAVDHGAKVLNISYGGLYSSSTIASMATYVKNKGGVVFASAGNDGQYLGSNVAADIIFVSATNSSSQKTSWSNYGPIISVAAPGDGILTTNNGGGYGYWNGTSFASPLAAGVAALMWSTNPSLSVSQMRSLILQATDDVGAPGKDDEFGYGKVNAYKAVQLALSLAGPSPTPTPIATPAATPTPAPTPTPTPAPVSDWTWCADENGTCSFSGTRTVRYVAGSAWATRTATGSIACNNATFGDPLVGTAKHCEFSNATVVSPTPTPTPVPLATPVATPTPSPTPSPTPVSTQDSVAPSVAITSPSAGATVVRNANVTVQASDNVAVTQVSLYVDGNLVGSSTSAPFTIAWNTKKSSVGGHVLTVKARDAAGNVGTSSSVTVNVGR